MRTSDEFPPESGFTQEPACRAVDAHVLRLTLPEGFSGRIDHWLVEQLPQFSRAFLQQLIKEGAITCNGSAFKASSRFRPGDELVVQLPPPPCSRPRPEKLPLNILYEDEELLLLDKPPALVVHPAPGHHSGTLVNALLHHCPELAGVGDAQRPGIVHRLDKDSSGLLLIAKNDRSMTVLIETFKSGALVREYLALVHRPPLRLEGTIRAAIGRHPVARKRMAALSEGGKPAVTHYRLSQSLGYGTAELHCRIESGRTHQIRVHLGVIGSLLLGDVLYGKASLDRLLPLRPARQMLHATRLALRHPVSGAALDFTSAPPPDYAAMVAALAESC